MQPATLDLFPSNADHAPEMLTGLRERAAEHADLLAPMEALAVFLARSRPRTAMLDAATLLKRFGSLARAMAADYSALAAMVGADAATDLKLVQSMAGRLSRDPIEKRCVISSWSALQAYVRTTMQGGAREQFRVLFLDRKNQLITDEIMSEGTVDHAPLYPREIMRRALELGASSLILVHNHPSGDPTPSNADVDMTRQIVEAAKALSITVHDHLVVGVDGTASLKALALM